jgi:alcohol dehydrogenase class IV
MQEEFIDKGSIKNIQYIVNKLNVKKILLVTGKKSFSLCGAKNKIDILLKNINFVKFNSFQPNPTLEDTKCGIKLLRENNPDLVVAIGGGSVIDMAKMINIFSAQKDIDLMDYIEDSALIKKKGAPLVAIPTTIGTGSEATHFAVVYVDKVKYSLAHQFMLPDYVIVDTELSCNLPKNIVAASGMDALSQAVESYWAVKSTNESKKYASEAIVLALGSIKDAVKGDKKARMMMSKAAYLAGKAINITTTTAPHAISYPITTYFGLQHGHAVALTLGKFFVINNNFHYSDLIDVRGEEYLKNNMMELFVLFGTSSALECRDKWYEIMKSINLESNMHNVGIKSSSDIEDIINNVNIERLENNPIKIRKNELKKIFQ